MFSLSFCLVGAGLFTGCFVTLFVVYAILAHISGMFSPGSKDESGYMETVYPIFRYMSHSLIYITEFLFLERPFAIFYPP